MTMQPSRTTMKTATACEQALHLRDIEETYSGVARGRRSGRSKVRGKEVRAHSRVRLPLEMERFLPGKTFLGGRAGSLFGEPACIRQEFRGKIGAIYILRNVRYGFTSSFLHILTNP